MRASLDARFLFACFTLLMAPFFLWSWYFIPLATFFALQPRYGIFRSLPILSLLGTFANILLDRLLVTEIDMLNLYLLFLAGFMIFFMRMIRRSYLEVIIPWLFLGVTFSLIFWLARRLWVPGLSFDQWSESQLISESFPRFFREDAWREEVFEVYASRLKPFFQNGIFGWFAAMNTLSLLINGMVEEMLRNFKFIPDRIDEEEEEAQGGALWDRFSLWKAPEIILIPLFGALVALAIDWAFTSGHLHSEIYSQISFYLRPIAASALVACLFPVFVQGLALTSFFLPRLSFFFVLLVIAGLMMSPIPLLLLAGGLDLWFDFRSRLGTNSTKKF